MPQKPPPPRILRDKHEGKLSLPMVKVAEVVGARPSRQRKSRKRRVAGRRSQARRGTRPKRRERKAA